MREFWANVYPDSAMREKHGGWWSDRASALIGRGDHAGYLIHVRMKPEGAPRRYASPWQRALWENNPEGMRRCAEWEGEQNMMTQPYVAD